MQSLNVRASGMVTGVGYSAAATCAAIRGGIAGFSETQFKLDGQWVVGSMVQVEEGLGGREKLLEMATMAVEECLDVLKPDALWDMPVLLCLAESERAGRMKGLDQGFLDALLKRLSLAPARISSSQVLAGGRVGGVQALQMARRLLAQGRASCIVVGVDSYLAHKTLAHYHGQQRLKTEKNSNGFVPGEGAAALLLCRDGLAESDLCCLGMGTGREKAALGSGLPMRADGLTQAIKAALRDGRCSFRDIDYRISDLGGEQYQFKEASVALSRVMRERKPELDLWAPCECVGEVGAAVVPLVLGIALSAVRKGYAPGAGVLCHFGNEREERAAVVLKAQGRRD